MVRFYLYILDDYFSLYFWRNFTLFYIPALLFVYFFLSLQMRIAYFVNSRYNKRELEQFGLFLFFWEYNNWVAAFYYVLSTYSVMSPFLIFLVFVIILFIFFYLNHLNMFYMFFILSYEMRISEKCLTMNFYRKS